MKTKSTILIKLNAGNDHNGNPRRIFVGLNPIGIIATWDEGYRGYNAVPEEYRDMATYAVEFETTVKEYRGLLKLEAERI